MTLCSLLPVLCHYMYMGEGLNVCFIQKLPLIFLSFWFAFVNFLFGSLQYPKLQSVDFKLAVDFQCLHGHICLRTFG